MNTPLRKPWRFEDSLTAREKVEALSLFKAGKLQGTVPRRVVVDFAPPTKLEKYQPSKDEPLVTPLQVATGGAILISAFFVGRWWARRHQTAKPATTTPEKKPVGLIGLDLLGAG